jgi:hypothetical protein
LAGFGICLPVAQQQHDVGIVRLGGVAVDDQDAFQAAAELFHGLARSRFGGGA